MCKEFCICIGYHRCYEFCICIGYLDEFCICFGYHMCNEFCLCIGYSYEFCFCIGSHMCNEFCSSCPGDQRRGVGLYSLRCWDPACASAQEHRCQGGEVRPGQGGQLCRGQQQRQ